MSKDISIQNITVRVPGKTLLENTDLTISANSKYGLVGKNGIGKSSLLKHIAERILPIGEHIDIFYVNQELEFDGDKTVYEIVLSANRKRMKLSKRLDKVNDLLEEADEEIDNADGTKLAEEKEREYDRLTEEYNDITEKLEELNSDLDESVIRKILHGLGFSQQEQNKKFKEFSGGWKMRVSLARGLYMKPTLLLLDEPTNHLDLNAVIWLTDYLMNEWKKSLIVVSHDTHFINEVCTNIIHINNDKGLDYYKGDYDSFKKMYEQHLRELEREWKIILQRVKEMKKKHTPKKETQKFLADNAHKEPPKDYRVRISFESPPKIPWPSLSLKNVSFGFENSEKLLENINLSLYEGEKIVIVGPNGVGKSTLLNLLKGTSQQIVDSLKEDAFEPTEGEIQRDSRLRIGFYNQHVSDVLPNDITPVEFLQTIDQDLKVHDARKMLGSTSLAGELHLQKMSTLSGGQKARVVISSLTARNPHILLLDEPTNHLDVESIDSFISAVNDFSGAVIMITHNIDVIQKTKSIIYELTDKRLKRVDFDTYYDKVLEDINASYD